MSSLHLRYFQYFPPAIWNPGGGEWHSHRTIGELNAIGIPMKRLDIENPKPLDLLHIFGSSLHVCELGQAVADQSIRLVVSTIAYSNRADWQWLAARTAWRAGRGVPLNYALRRRLFEVADCLITSSQAERMQVVHRYQVSPSKVNVSMLAVDDWPEGGDAERFRRQWKIDFPFVLQCGRINTHKGQLRTLEAANRVGIGAVFIGARDPSDAEVESEVRRQSVQARYVRMLDALPNSSQGIADALAASAAHVLPSLSECPGLVNLEASRAKRPVVSGYCAPLYEYLGDDAIYVNPRSVKSVANGIVAALDGDSQSRALRLYNKVSAMTWAVRAQEIASLYSGVLGMSEAAIRESAVEEPRS